MVETVVRGGPWTDLTLAHMSNRIGLFRDTLKGQNLVTTGVGMNGERASQADDLSPESRNHHTRLTEALLVNETTIWLVTMRRVCAQRHRYRSNT